LTATNAAVSGGRSGSSSLAWRGTELLAVSARASKSALGDPHRRCARAAGGRLAGVTPVAHAPLVEHQQLGDFADRQLLEVTSFVLPLSLTCLGA
jgi:hypothetical protein